MTLGPFARKHASLDGGQPPPPPPPPPVPSERSGARWWWVAAAGVVAVVAAVVVVVFVLGGDEDTPTAASSSTATSAAQGSTSTTGSTEPPSTTTSSTEAPTTTVGPGEAPGEIFLEPADSNGPDPFGARELAGAVVSTTSTLVSTTTSSTTTLTTQAGQVVVQARAGDQPGLYGGTRDNARCDSAAMLEFLKGDMEKAQAWVEALSRDPDFEWGDADKSLEVGDLDDLFLELTPAILIEDTRVTNHGFREGRATPRQSVLEKGTAVLVDKYGLPRARCACGNPLAGPMPSTQAPAYVGPQWPDWQADKAVVVRKAEAPIDEFKLIDVVTAEFFTRPTGTQGDTDALATIGPIMIAGEWVGTFAVTELVIPDGGTLPDGTEVTPGTYTPEDCRAAASQTGELDPETEDALDQMEAGVPMTAIFTGTLEEPGTVSIALDEGGDAQESPWRAEGPTITFGIVDDAGDIVFSGTVSDGVMSGTWQSASSDGFQMRGVFSLTRMED